MDRQVEEEEEEEEMRRQRRKATEEGEPKLKRPLIRMKPLQLPHPPFSSRAESGNLTFLHRTPTTN